MTDNKNEPDRRTTPEDISEAISRMHGDERTIGENVGRKNFLDLNKDLFGTNNSETDEVPIRTIERSYNNGVRIYGEGDEKGYGKETSTPNLFTRGLERTIDFVGRAFLREGNEIRTIISSTNPISKEIKKSLEEKSQEAYDGLRKTNPNLREAVFEIELSGKNYSVIMSEGLTKQTKKTAKIVTMVSTMLLGYGLIVGGSVNATKQALSKPYKQMTGIVQKLTDNPSYAHIEGQKLVITDPTTEKEVNDITAVTKSIVKKIGAEAAINIRANYGTIKDESGMRKDIYGAEINVKLELNPVKACKIIYNAHKLNK